MLRFAAEFQESGSDDVTILPIRTFGDPVLNERVPETKPNKKNLNELVKNLGETMHEAPGVGLAANQVGKDLHLAIIDVSPMDQEKDLVVLINPEIIHAEGKEIMEEGCLSLPGFKTEVPRSAKVVVRAYDLDMKPFDIEGEGLLARALQHEIDHLNGKLFPDRISRIKREMLLRKVRKAIEAGEFGKE